MIVMPVARHDLTEFVIPREHSIQGLKLFHHLGRERLAHMIVYERAKPFSQGPRLRRHSVELTGNRGSA